MSMGHGEHGEWYFQNPAVYRFLRGAVNLGRFTSKVGEYLQAGPSESVIDVGCGVGDFSRLAPGAYEGYDLNQKFVEYAEKKFGTPKKRFFNQDVLTLPEEKKPCDKGIMVNILHHFNDEELNRLLAGSKRLVQKHFVIVDADWDGANRLQRWLLKKDQGSYLRSRENLLELLSRHFTLQDFDLFHSRSGSVCLFRCKGFPKHAG